jgi:hypothetical protein
MPSLCFKRRRNGKTVQLVRHIYSPAVQRSRTVTVGSLPMDADPNDFRHELHLRPGEELALDDEWAVRRWLDANGDKVAAERRQEAAARIAAKVRAEVEAEFTAKSAVELATGSMAQPIDVMVQAVLALDTVISALPELVAQANARGEDAWKELRPRYLSINKAWQSLMRAAQKVGVAKKARRKSRTSAAVTPN